MECGVDCNSWDFRLAPNALNAHARLVVHGSEWCWKEIWSYGTDGGLMGIIQTNNGCRFFWEDDSLVFAVVWTNECRSEVRYLHLSVWVDKTRWMYHCCEMIELHKHDLVKR